MLKGVSEEELAEVRWGFDLCEPPGSGVAELVPPVFESYARIFHPGMKYGPHSACGFKWQYIAMRTNRKAHALMNWEKIAIPDPQLFTINLEPPAMGTLPYEVSRQLRRLLAPWSELCYFAIWRGWGTEYYASYVPSTAVIDTGDGRDYDVFVGPATMLDFPFCIRQIDQTANIFWATNRSWWIATDIDFITTYIGGEKRLIDSILDCDDLEAWPVLPTDDISSSSDKINV